MIPSKYFTILILVLISTGFFIACNNDDPIDIDNHSCKPVSTDPGILVSEPDFGTCFFEKEADYYLIEDSISYDSLINKFSNGILCENESFPVIDFSEYALLGLWADGGGCSINYYRTVGDIQDEHKYIYTVTVQECGFCEMYGFSYNWVLVPKLPTGYTVDFQVKNI